MKQVSPATHFPARCIDELLSMMLVQSRGLRRGAAQSEIGRSGLAGRVRNVILPNRRVGEWEIGRDFGFEG